jgi:hypothetical protein
MSKIKYIIQNGNNLFSVFETENGRLILVLDEKLDPKHPIIVRSKSNDELTWEPISGGDINDWIMDLIP